MTERKKAPAMAGTARPPAKKRVPSVTPTPQSAPAKKRVAAKKAPVASSRKVAAKKASPAARTKISRRETVHDAATAPRAATADPKPLVSRAERERMIGEAAFLISQRRHPSVGSPETDWLSAETVIDMIFDVAD